MKKRTMTPLDIRLLGMMFWFIKTGTHADKQELVTFMESLLGFHRKQHAAREAKKLIGRAARSI